MYINNLGDKVELTNKTATNSNGTKLLWVKCENGAIVSIFENEFKKQFNKL